LFRSGITENIMVSTHGYPGDVYLNISLYNDDNTIYTSVSQTVKSGMYTRLIL